MHRDIIVASNNTDLCHHFSGVCLNAVCSAGEHSLVPRLSLTTQANEGGEPGDY